MKNELIKSFLEELSLTYETMPCNPAEKLVLFDNDNCEFIVLIPNDTKKGMENGFMLYRYGKEEELDFCKIAADTLEFSEYLPARICKNRLFFNLVYGGFTVYGDIESAFDRIYASNSEFYDFCNYNGEKFIDTYENRKKAIELYFDNDVLIFSGVVLIADEENGIDEEIFYKPGLQLDDSGNVIFITENFDIYNENKISDVLNLYAYKNK